MLSDASLVAIVPSNHTAAKSGDWAVVELDSYRESGPSCSATRGGDARHYWYVGVYAP